MARPDDQSSNRQPPGIRGKVILARMVLGWEALWPALWPAVAVAGLFLSMALLDILPALPGWVHALLLVAFVFLFSGALIRGLRSLSLPGPDEGKRRLERASGLDHRPLTAVDDSLAGGANNVAATELWREHQRRMAETVRHLRVGAPSPGLARRDPRALRTVLILLLVFAAVAGWSDPVQRLARAVSPTLQQQSTAPALVLDLWITPPDYTGLPPLFPLRIAKQAPTGNSTKTPALENQTGDKATGESKANPADAQIASIPTLAIPAGSILTAQIQGSGSQPRLILDKDQTPFDSVDPAYSKIVKKITTNGRLSVVAGDRTLGTWQVTLLDDQKPAIAFANPPGATPQATLRLSYTASDDYGVTKARAEIRRTYERGTVTGKEVHLIELPLPGRAARMVNETSFIDLAPHKWAGQSVIIELVAADALEQTGKSEPVRLVLPERIFSHPVARAIIEQRKRLANQPEQRRTVLHGLSEIASEPGAFSHDAVVYLALVTARSRLAYDSSDAVIEPILNLLWDTALRLEDGKLSIAERELRRIQQALMKALAEGASDAKLEQLMRELQQAIARYMAALQEQMQRNPNAQQQVMEFDPKTMRLIQGSDIQRMLDQIRQLMQSGARQAAREMLARLQRMLSGMRSMQVMRRGGPGNQGNSALRQLQELIQRQQQLMEQTFRSGRPGNQQGQMPGAADQRALQRLLQQLQGMMKGGKPGEGPGQALGQANEAMERAIRSLEGNRPGDAVGAQGNALDQLRRAGRGLLQQMMERFARQSGNRPNQQGQPNQPRRDPLGREAMGDDIDSNGIKIPDASSVQRAREILDELRRRSGQINRQPLELDYINRLLQRF
ncbi:MAG: TIGR02302 family protein [Proteobacteria bacterium]|nr:TIGR02302 family protein [Pseudomonadota bacterium]MDA1324745.1 TIGR02302 family protein [Pseudomonadota bacterium]